MPIIRDKNIITGEAVEIEFQDRPSTNTEEALPLPAMTFDPPKPATSGQPKPQPNPATSGTEEALPLPRMEF